jgi:hypothetical protein
MIAPRLPGLVAVLINLILVGSTLGLVRRPALMAAAWAAFFALSALFSLVYPGGYRHQGLFLVFLITLTWISFDAEPGIPQRKHSSVLERIGLWGCLPALLVTSLASGIYKLAMDVFHTMSASRAFGAYLEAHPEHQGAILIGEPDFYIESMPNYADNPIYIVREHRFGDTVRFTRQSDAHLDLGDLLREAKGVAAWKEREVLIAIGHLKTLGPLLDSGDRFRSVGYGFDRTFTCSQQDLKVWRASTELLACFADDILGDEQYALYKLSAAPP